MTYRAYFLILMGLPFVPLAGGCGRTACFQWSEAEGACPGADEAIRFFGDPCNGTVQSVEGEGFFDGQLCCYAVTEVDRGRFEAGNCAEGVGGAGGAQPGTTSVSSAVTSVGSGPMQCTRCSQALNASNIFEHGALCPGSDILFNDLIACLCGGACAAQCTSTVCAGTPPPQECIDCLVDSNLGCGSPLAACLNDV